MGQCSSFWFRSANVVVLCDGKAIRSLLDKKGNIYSDMPDRYPRKIPTHATMLPYWRVLAYDISPKNLNEKHRQVLEVERVNFPRHILNKVTVDRAEQSHRRHG